MQKRGLPCVQVSPLRGRMPPFSPESPTRVLPRACAPRQKTFLRPTGRAAGPEEGEMPDCLSGATGSGEAVRKKAAACPGKKGLLLGRYAPLRPLRPGRHERRTTRNPAALRQQRPARLSGKAFSCTAQTSAVMPRRGGRGPFPPRFPEPGGKRRRHFRAVT